MASTKRGAALTDVHRRRQVQTAITADSQARRLWDKTLDLTDLKTTQPIWKNTMIRLLQAWWNISAHQAADYLPQFREAEIGAERGFEVSMPRFDPKNPGLDLDFFGSTNVKWHQNMGLTQQAAYDAARQLFLGAFHEAVLAGGRKTVEKTARKDPRALGWRRVSDGHPCAFCAMLVTRGPAYLSGETAGIGKKFHAHCGCTVEPVYNDWKPTEQEQQWIDQYYNAAESLPDKTPRTAGDILPLMRKQGGFRDSPPPDESVLAE